MKRNGQKARIRGQVVTVDKSALRELIDKEARERLGLSGEEALEQIRKGQAGDNYVWTDLSMLANMLR